ncbi:MAG: ATP-binding protein [Cyanobacteriota bacterium]|nr:ATP-binding protein [Cyanobacteriota bacterium]
MAMCEVHGVERKPIEVNGRVIGEQCSECAMEQYQAIRQRASEEDSKVVREHEVNSRREAKQKRLDVIGIPPRFRNRRLNNYQVITDKQRKARKMIADYAERLLSGAVCGGLVLTGNPGTGKTHLACAVANAYQQQDKTVAFMSVAAMIRKIRESYRSDSSMTEGEAIRAFRDIDLLLLDEVGRQKGDEKEINLLMEVINERYGWEKPTVLLSNLDLGKMNSLLGEPIIDRMREDGGMVINFDWESFRGQASGVHRA